MTVLTYVINTISKRLKFGVYIRTGKNFSGKTCVFHRGGGNKKIYRHIDFYRRLNLFGTIYLIQRDPNRSAYLGLVCYTTGLFSYIVLAQNVNLGNKIYSGTKLVNTLCLSTGSSLLLSELGLFSIINNIELRPKFGSSVSKAAGNSAVLIAKTKKFVTLKLKSG